MSNIFNKAVEFKEIVKVLNLKASSFDDVLISSISDTEEAKPNSICDYVKGPLPKPHNDMILFVKAPLDGYNCSVVDNPQERVVHVIEYIKSTVGFKELYGKNGVHPSVVIGQNVVIENDVEIGENTVVDHNVVIHTGTKIGNNCILRSNSSIGGQGYGFYTNCDGDLKNFPSLGGVVLEDNVEVGYGCAIVKGTINNTILRKNVKLDNLIHIAHDCIIGEGATVTAGVSFCGYVIVGDNTRIAPQATVKQRIKIGSDVVVGLGAVVTKDVPDNSVVAGNPAKRLRV
jgi:UDP-3-O-[3-hydroxymyristoyl] glucosamine N-acyltransferase